MAEGIHLEVPATLYALSTVRAVLGGLGARLDFSLEDIEDIYVATEGLLAAAIDTDAPERLNVEVLLDDGRLRLAAGTFTSAKLRADVTTHVDDCLDLCMLLRRTVDDVLLEDVGGEYRVVLVKERQGGRA